MENTEKTIDISAESQAYAQSVFALSESINKALRKGVRFRVIVENSEDTEAARKAVQEFIRMPNYKFKTLNMKPIIKIAIYDKKEVIMAIVSGKYFAESPALWSNNPNLVEIVQNYFESMWEKAT